jgi:hypothetical protein
MTGAWRLAMTWPLGVVAASVCGVADAEPIGRLFFTPEYRVALERQRRLGIGDQGKPVSLDGVVAGSRGGLTIWTNQHVRHGSRADPTAPVVVPTQDASRATIFFSDSAPVALKVGETLDLTTGLRTDSLAGGRVTVNRQR